MNRRAQLALAFAFIFRVGTAAGLGVDAVMQHSGAALLAGFARKPFLISNETR
jgi:hypothetical protein